VQPPAQLQRQSINLRESFLQERKPILKLRVLALNIKPMSWIQDAKNCVRIYSRMLQSRAVCPRVLPLLSQWSSYLLEYAPDYGFGDPNIQFVKRRPSIFQSYEWLRRLLLEIQVMDDAAKIYGRMVTGFHWCAMDKGSVIAITDPICTISHKSMKNIEHGVWWKTILDNGKEIDSLATDAHVFRWIEKMIRQGLRRHRRDGYRANLSKSIRARRK